MIRTVSAALGIALLACGSAQAQTIDYDCDTPAQRVSAIKRAVSGTDFSMSGTVTPREAYDSGEYGATAGIRLEAPDGSWFVNIGIVRSFDDEDRDPDEVPAFLHSKSGDIETVSTFGNMKLGRAYRFTLTVAGGRGKAVLDGDYSWVEARSIDFEVPSATQAIASISCETGHFLFGEVDFGR
ncbi:hypothetical protein P1X14_03090 [Sphingomonas sp. AOB5]|uniref:hypothetical protein n=1 Tax=Sphingomonas sp. AOB5 TaxID=3034017 RepID=UPI0023F73399|nr:hypothetical protein [Sphingomonas sp. AOB5]MDF7774223.1 hypothetical protein [Sphingomonas sp. AOB5]